MTSPRHGYRLWDDTPVPHPWQRPYYTDGYMPRHGRPTDQLKSAWETLTAALADIREIEQQYSRRWSR